MYENQFRENLKDKGIAFINGIQLTLFIIITNNAYENQLGELLKKKNTRQNFSPSFSATANKIIFEFLSSKNLTNKLINSMLA